MAQLPAVFISYNPYSEVGQTLAIRLHTIGAVNGFNTLLPDRSLGSKSISTETKNRILLSDLFILFSTEPMSSVVQQEINAAFSKLHDKSKILVIYDKRIGKNIVGAGNCTEIFIDTRQDALKIVTEITNSIKAVQPKKSVDGFLTAISGILLIGLGLFTLNEVFTQSTKKPRKPVRRTSLKKVVKKRKA